MDLYKIRNELAQGRSIYDLDLRVTYYARVSSESDEQLHSLCAQKDYFADFISSKTNWQYVKGYVDEGISGTSVKKRESFLRMIKDAHLHRFDFIITKEVSRFARNTLDSIKYTQELLSYGVGVLFQSDNINTLMSDSELRLTIMASVAQDEVRKTSERVKFGFKRAIEKGVVLGSNRIWGYEKDNGSLIIVEEEAKIVRKIFKMYALDNMGMRSIANQLTVEGYRNTNNKPFGFSTISGILSNPKYKGYYCGNKTHKVDYKLDTVKYLNESEWVMYQDEENVPPIVSEELWGRAEQLRQRRSKKYGKPSANNRYPYSGKIICLEHQVPFYRAVYKYKSGDKEVWQCKKYGEKGKKGCSAPVLYTSELDSIMNEVGNCIITNRPSIIRDMMDMYQSISGNSNRKKERVYLKEQIDSIQMRKDKILDLCIAKNITDEEFRERNQQFSQQINEYKKKIEQLSKDELNDNEVIKNQKALKGLITAELAFKEGYSNDIVEAMLERIEVSQSNKDFDDTLIKIYVKVFDDGGEEALPFRTVLLRNKPRVLLFDSDDPYYPCQCQHGDNTPHRHGEAV